MSVTERWRFPQLVRCIGIGATLAGVGFWGWALLPQGTDVVDEGGSPLPTTASPVDAVARWFDPVAARLDIRVVGVVGGSAAQAAVLEVNDAAPRVHVPGERLGPSTTLLEVEPNAIVIDRAGTLRRLPLAIQESATQESLISARRR